MSQTKIIKRYQNRKLYDTESSQYVTLDDIAQMIKNKEDVKVIDNKTKQDITSLTLTQIIFEEEKKQKSLLPLDALKKLIQSGGGSISDIFERVVQPGINSIQSARDEMEKVVARLIKRGRLDPEEGKGLLKEFRSSGAHVQRKIDASWAQMVELVRGISILARDVSRLERQVDELADEIKRLKEQGVIRK